MLATAYTLSDQLPGDLDVDATAERIPDSYVVKGMFFSRHVERLGPAFGDVMRGLKRPPAGGRYVGFRDYPQADYFRLSSSVALRAFARLPLREALRRLARDDFAVFASSTFGRVVLAVARDAHRALLTLPSVYSKMAPGDWTITGEELDDRCVRLEFGPQYGSWEYQLGQLEGLVLHYDARPEITISELEENVLRFDVRHH